VQTLDIDKLYLAAVSQPPMKTIEGEGERDAVRPMQIINGMRVPVFDASMPLVPAISGDEDAGTKPAVAIDSIDGHGSDDGGETAAVAASSEW
jgi:hypothetical protein